MFPLLFSYPSVPPPPPTHSITLPSLHPGSYLFTIDRPTERINLVSPMSGAHSYFFDQEEQLWLSMNTDRYCTSTFQDRYIAEYNIHQFSKNLNYLIENNP